MEADNQFRTDQMKQQADQFTSSLGAEEQRFVRTLAEQQASRLQQFGISTRQLDMDAARLKQEAELQGRSLTLQEARDLAEVDYRTQSLQQQAQLQGRSLDIEQARNEATIGFQRDQLAVDEALRRDGLAVDRERLTAAQKQFDADLAQRKEALTAQERQSDLDRQLRETLGMGELTGMVGGQQTIGARTAQQNLLVQLASAMAGSEKGIPANFLQQLYAALGIYNPPGGENNQDTTRDPVLERRRGQTTGTPGGTTTRTTTQTTSDTAGPRRRGG
jgi:hypothetical protein